MHLYSDLCKSMLLSEWCNRSVIRIGEVTLTHHPRSACDPCFVFRFKRFMTDTRCFCKSLTLGNREITNLANDSSYSFSSSSRSRIAHVITVKMQS